MFDEKDIAEAKRKNAMSAAQKGVIHTININHDEKVKQIEAYRRKTGAFIVKALREFPSAAARADTYLHVFGRHKGYKIYDGNIYSNDPEQSSLFVDQGGRVYYLSFEVKSGRNSFELKRLKGSKRKAAHILAAQMVKSFPYTNINLLNQLAPEERVKRYFMKMLVQEKDNL